MVDGVVPDGSVGREFRGELSHTLAHACEPFARSPIAGPVVEFRDNFLLQQGVHSFGFGGIHGGIIAVVLAVTDCPTDLGRIGLRPPAIKLREIQPAIDQDLHPAGSTCFPGTAWGVYPEVGAFDQLLRHQHVVVAEKDNMFMDFRTLDEVIPFFDECLSGQVLRMRLAGED